MAGQVPVPPPEGSLFTTAERRTDGQTDAASLRQGHPDVLETAGPCRESKHPQRPSRLS